MVSRCVFEIGVTAFSRLIDKSISSPNLYFVKYKARKKSMHLTGLTNK